MAGQGGLDADAMWAELKKADSSKVIDASHIPTSVLDGRWVKKAGDTMTGTLTSASTNNAIIFKGLENCDITNFYTMNGTLDSNSRLAIRNGLRFNWYDTYWYIGNLRGESTDSNGFGIANESHKLCLQVTPNNTIAPVFRSTVATGLSPLIVSSNTLVNNLNADLLDGYHQSKFLRTDGVNQHITLTGGDGNTEGYRLVLEATVTGGWSVNSMTLLVNSRHSGTGIISLVFHTTNKESTSYEGSLNYYGSTIQHGGITMWRLFYNTTTKKIRLFWHFYDYNDCQVSILNRMGFTTNISNGTWYTTLPSDNGNELLSYYNSASSLAASRTLWGQPFNGTANVSGNMTGVGSINMSGQLTSTVASGTAPFIVSSNTVVGNLNADMVDGLHLSDFDGRYVKKAGDTMIGDLTMNNKGFNIVQGTRVVKSSGNWIHGGSDTASVDDANLRFGSWNGIGWYPTVSGQTVAQGKNAMWLNVRNGNLDTHGAITAHTNYLAANWDSARRLVLGGGSSYAWIDSRNSSNNVLCNILLQDNKVVIGNYAESSRFVSTVGTGTQPYQCSSTTLNTNLNADMLDNWHLNFLPRNYNIGRCYAVRFALGGTDNGWKKIFACSESGAGPYRSVTVWGRIWYAYGNHAQEQVRYYHFCAIFCMRSNPSSSDSSVGNVENSARLYLPTFAKGMDNIRLVRVGTNNFELQVRQIGAYHNANIEYQYWSYGCNVSAWENLQSTSNTSVAVSAGGASTLSDSRASSADVWTTARTFYIQDHNASHTGAGVSVNGSSNVYLKLPSSIQCGDWFRSTGNSGWYHQDFGGGIYMQDSTYVRVYGGKRFYVGNTENTDFSTNTAISTDGGIYAKKNITSYANIIANGTVAANWDSARRLVLGGGSSYAWIDSRNSSNNVLCNILLQDNKVVIGNYAESSRFVSTVGTGTQPYQCSSTTLNTNLNADMLDNWHLNFLPRNYNIGRCYAVRFALGGTDNGWKKIFACSESGAGPYRSVTVWGRIWYAYGNHAQEQVRYYHFCAIFCMRSNPSSSDSSVGNVENSARLYLPTFAKGMDNIRLVRVGTNNFELQVRQIGAYHNANIEYQYWSYGCNVSAWENLQSTSNTSVAVSAGGASTLSDSRASSADVWTTARTFYIQDHNASHTGAGVSVNGSSNVYLKLPSSIQCGDWFRSTGNSGWYHQDFGGGIYMQDSTYVRVYGGKRFYVGNTENTDFSTNTAISTDGGIYAKKNITSYANIIANGTVAAKSSSSDRRLKRNICDFSASDIIRKLHPKTFYWNETAKRLSPALNHDKLNYGLIAQDVESMPELPLFASNIFGDYLILQYEKFIPILIQGVKEVDDEVTRLKKRVKELEKRLGINNK